MTEASFLISVREALELGHRPADVVGLEERDLRKLLNRAAPAVVVPEVDQWLERIIALDGPGFERALRESLIAEGARPFVTRVLMLMTIIGERWCRGELTVAQEHLASAVAQAFLARQWMPMAEGPGPAVALSTLPGEHHGLPLHIAALLLGLRQARIVFVGPDVPVPDLIVAARRSEVDALLLGFSRAPNETAARHLSELEQGLDEGVLLAAGGQVPSTCRRTVRIRSFEDLEVWFDQVVAAGRGAQDT